MMATTITHTLPLLDRKTLAWLRWSGIAGIVGSVGYLIGDAAVSRSSLVGQQKAVRYDSTNHIFGVDSTNSTAALTFRDPEAATGGRT